MTRDLKALIGPELADRFASLLYSWVIRGLRGEVHFPRGKLVRRAKGATENEIANINFDYERQYGDQHYGDRRLMLTDVLQKLRETPRIDLDEVCDILELAKFWMSFDLLNRYNRGLNRSLDSFDKSVRQLRKAGARARQLGADLIDYYESANPGTPCQYPQPALLAALDALLHVLEAHPDLPPVPAPHRGSKVGRPSEPWLQSARRALVHEHVREDLRETLLMAVCLTPYRRDEYREDK